MLDEDGYLYIMARTDDVINVAGHRLSTGAMEEVLAGHPDVAECAVIGVSDPMKGQVPMGFLCLNKGCNRPHDEIAAECIARVRDEIGPVAAFKQAVVVDRLPKTRSGKILRATMAKIADGEAVQDAGDHRRSCDPRGDRRGDPTNRLERLASGRDRQPCWRPHVDASHPLEVARILSVISCSCDEEASPIGRKPPWSGSLVAFVNAARSALPRIPAHLQNGKLFAPKRRPRDVCAFVLSRCNCWNRSRQTI